MTVSWSGVQPELPVRRRVCQAARPSSRIAWRYQALLVAAKMSARQINRCQQCSAGASSASDGAARRCSASRRVPGVLAWMMVARRQCAAWACFMKPDCRLCPAPPAHRPQTNARGMARDPAHRVDHLPAEPSEFDPADGAGIRRVPARCQPGVPPRSIGRGRRTPIVVRTCRADRVAAQASRGSMSFFCSPGATT